MAIVKVPLVARRVEYIEGALEKLVHELGSAEGVRWQRWCWRGLLPHRRS